MRRVLIEHALVALLGLVELLPVFVQHAQVHQRADKRRKLRHRALVIVERRVVVAVAVVFLGQSEQRARVIAIGFDGALEQGHDFRGAAPQGRDRGAALIQVFGRLFDGARQRVERLQGGIRVARGPLGFGPAEHAGVVVVAGLSGRGIAGNCVAVLFEGEVAPGQVEMRERSAVSGLERLHRSRVAAQQVVAHAQADGAGRATVFAQL